LAVLVERVIVMRAAAAAVEQHRLARSAPEVEERVVQVSQPQAAQAAPAALLVMATLETPALPEREQEEEDGASITPQVVAVQAPLVVVAAAAGVWKMVRTLPLLQAAQEACTAAAAAAGLQQELVLTTH
jgi:hypothetical protein